MHHSVTQVSLNPIAPCFYGYTVADDVDLFLYLQERMPQQLLTVFTFWLDHWMQGLFVFS